MNGIASNPPTPIFQPITHTKLQHSHTVTVLVVWPMISYNQLIIGQLMKNKLKDQIRELDGKLFIELPAQVIEKLSVSNGDNAEFGLGKHIHLWKSPNIDVQEDIYNRLLDIFKTDDVVFQWLNSKRAFFQGKVAIELVSTDVGKKRCLIYWTAWQQSICRNWYYSLYFKN